MKALCDCCSINEVASTQRTHYMCINVSNSYLQYLKHNAHTHNHFKAFFLDNPSRPVQEG